MEEQNLTTNKKKKWLLPVIITAILIIAAIIIAIIYNLPANRRDRQLALAEKYLSELNYEAAILAYKAAIEIDPKCEDAYIELVNLYIVMGNYDKAEEVVAQAENNLDSQVILALKEKTKTLLALDDTNGDNSNEPTDEVESTTEKIPETETSDNKAETPMEILTKYKLTLSPDGYNMLIPAGNCYITSENDLFGALNSDLEMIIPCEYSYFKIFDDGFTLYYNNNGLFTCILYDNNGNIIFSNNDYPDYYIGGFYDNVIQLIKPVEQIVDNAVIEYNRSDNYYSETRNEYIYLDLSNNNSIIYSSLDNELAWVGSFREKSTGVEYNDNGSYAVTASNWLLPYYNGYINSRRISVKLSYYDTYFKSCDRNGNFKSIISDVSSSNYSAICLKDIYSDEFIVSETDGITDDGIVVVSLPEYIGQDIATINFIPDTSVGDDGWVLGYVIYSQLDSLDYYVNGGEHVYDGHILTTSPSLFAYALYNINTKKLVFIHPKEWNGDYNTYLISGGIRDFSWQWEDSGKVTISSNNMMLINYDSTDSYYIWNIAEDKYMSDKKYKYVDIANSQDSPILAKNEDDKFGYLSKDFEELSWYDAASLFIDGQALVVLNDKIYAIDEELNFVSQGIDGTYVRAGVGNQFVIKKEDEKYYICTLEAIE